MRLFLNIIPRYFISFFKTQNTHGYLYITFKYYNTKLKKQINKKKLLHVQSNL